MSSIDRVSLQTRIIAILKDNPNFIDDLIQHCHTMMLDKARPALRGAIGWVYWSEGNPTLIVSLQNPELITEHRPYVHRYAEQFRQCAGIWHIRLMQGDRLLADLNYSPSVGKWFVDNATVTV